MPEEMKEQLIQMYCPGMILRIVNDNLLDSQAVKKRAAESYSHVCQHSANVVDVCHEFRVRHLEAFYGCLQPCKR